MTDVDISSITPVDIRPQSDSLDIGTLNFNESFRSQTANSAQELSNTTVTKRSGVEPSRDYRVSLRSSRRISRLVDIGLNKPLIFKVTPDFTENRQVNYKTMDPVHMPGNIHVYGNTSSRTFQISNARLFSSTPQEASENMEFVHRLRGWTMPFFGRSNTQSFATNSEGNTADFVNLSSSKFDDDFINRPPGGASAPEVLGLPPEVLLLTGYAPQADFAIESGRVPTNIFKVPVVISNLVIPYPSDIDYIPTMDGQPFPRIITIDLQLTETHSPREYERFSLSEYRNGVLHGF